jgi:hypothetical protein
LKLIFGVLTRAAERWKSIKFSEFERRTLSAVEKELDQEYEAQADLSRKSSKGAVKYPAVLRLDPNGAWMILRDRFWAAPNMTNRRIVATAGSLCGIFAIHNTANLRTIQLKPESRWERPANGWASEIVASSSWTSFSTR